MLILHLVIRLGKPTGQCTLAQECFAPSLRTASPQWIPYIKNVCFPLVKSTEIEEVKGSAVMILRGDYHV